MHELMKRYQEDFVLFLESGFIAVNQADEDSALKLFKAAQALNTASVMPKIGLGYLHLHKLELKQACEFFQEAIKKEPENEMAKTLLALSLSMSPNELDKSEKMLKEVKKSKDSSIKNLAGMITDFIEKFVKKSPTPVQGKEKKPKEKEKKKKTS